MQADGEVAFGRWDSAATILAVGEMRDHVRAFATRHGMPYHERRRLDLAVSEAVADVVGRAGTRELLGRVCVQAATDGACLTLLVVGDAPVAAGEPQPWLPLACTLAEHVEWGRAAAGGTRLLMEFAVDPGRDGAARPVHAAARAGRTARRRDRPARRGGH